MKKWKQRALEAEACLAKVAQASQCPECGSIVGVRPVKVEHNIVDPTHGNGGQEWCTTHDCLARECGREVY